MKKLTLLAILFSYFHCVSQTKINVDSFSNIKEENGIKWPVFKKNEVYYLINDSNKLADGIFKYTYQENSYIVEYYKNGYCLKEEDLYLNGNINSVLYYENNKIKDGVYAFYYDTGERKEDKTYLNGKLNGTSILYYRSGKIATIENYVDGTLNGKVVSFFENGVLSSEVFVENGEKNGASVLYYENGQKAIEEYYISTFKLGAGCKKFWYSNGKLAWEVCYDENGVRNGIEKALDEWGVLKYQKEWESGKVKSRKQFGSLDNLWFPNIVEGHREKMQYYFDNDDW